jgi:hypothetical protein
MFNWCKWLVTGLALLDLNFFDLGRVFEGTNLLFVVLGQLALVASRLHRFLVLLLCGRLPAFDAPVSEALFQVLLL